jgi:hypothetical protein
MTQLSMPSITKRRPVGASSRNSHGPVIVPCMRKGSSTFGSLGEMYGTSVASTVKSGAIRKLSVAKRSTPSRPRSGSLRAGSSQTTSSVHSSASRPGSREAQASTYLRAKSSTDARSSAVCWAVVLI